MHYLLDLCCICLCRKTDLQHLSDSHNEISYYAKLTSSISEICFDEMNYQGLVCKECCNNIDLVYKFRQICLRNQTILKDYITKLNLVTNINGAVSVDIIDFKKKFENKENIVIDHNHIVDDDGLNTNKKDQDYVQETNVNVEINIEPGKNERLDNNEIKVKIKNEKPECIQDVPLKKQEQVKIDIEHIKLEHDMTMEFENENTAAYEEKINNPFENNTENKKEIEDSLFQQTLTVQDEVPIQHVVDVSPEQFSQFHDLQAHKLNNVEGRAYECYICNKKFPQLSRLTRHMRIHSGEKQFECNICNKKFTHSGNLTEHMRIHTGEKPYECNICGKQFTQSGTLSKHMRSHTGERHFGCSICSKKFMQKHGLKTHMLKHSTYNNEEQTFECDVCHEIYYSMGLLLNHKRVHNSGGA